MKRKWFAIDPLRLLGLLLLAGAAGLASYQLLKPETFSYVRLRDGVTAEAGTPLRLEQVEPASFPLGGFAAANTPVAGLIPWEQAEQFVGMPLARRVTGGSPLLEQDFAQDDAEAAGGKLGKAMTGMSIPVDNIVGVTPHLTIGDKVHLYASFEDEDGAHTGLLLREMPVIALQREQDGAVLDLSAVTIALTLEEAVLLTHALHYGKIRLGRASALDNRGPGIGDPAFAAALLKTTKRWHQAEGGTG